MNSGAGASVNDASPFYQRPVPDHHRAAATERQGTRREIQSWGDRPCANRGRPVMAVSRLQSTTGLCLVILGGGGVNWPPWDFGSPSHPYAGGGGGHRARSTANIVHRNCKAKQSETGLHKVAAPPMCHNVPQPMKKRWRSTKLLQPTHPPTHPPKRADTPPPPWEGVPALPKNQGKPRQTHPPTHPQTNPPPPRYSINQPLSKGLVHHQPLAQAQWEVSQVHPRGTGMGTCKGCPHISLTARLLCMPSLIPSGISEVCRGLFWSCVA